MKKLITIIFALSLALSFTACSENIYETPVDEHAETLTAVLSAASSQEGDISVIEELDWCECFICFSTTSMLIQSREPYKFTSLADGNVVDFFIEFEVDYDTCAQPFGILLLELSEGLTLARNPQTFSNLMMVYNSDNGRIVFLGISKRDDIILRLTFEGVGTWTLSSIDEYGSLDLFEITGEADGQMPVYTPEPTHVHEALEDGVK
jgi:hypothetical protein